MESVVRRSQERPASPGDPWGQQQQKGGVGSEILWRQSLEYLLIDQLWNMKELTGFLLKK